MPATDVWTADLSLAELGLHPSRRPPTGAVLHRATMALFPQGLGDSRTSARSAAGVLFYADPLVGRVVLQAQLPPTIQALHKGSPLPEQAGELEVFGVVNAVYKATNGTRKPIPTDGMAEWLKQRLRGFDVIGKRVNVAAAPPVQARGVHHLASAVTATVTVSDREAAAETLLKGVGPGKAFGLGLLQVRQNTTSDS